MHLDPSDIYTRYRRCVAVCVGVSLRPSSDMRAASEEVCLSVVSQADQSIVYGLNYLDKTTLWGSLDLKRHIRLF